MKNKINKYSTVCIILYQKNRNFEKNFINMRNNVKALVTGCMSGFYKSIILRAKIFNK